MAKVLISLIGTGKKAKGDNEKNEYEKTDYLINGVIYEKRTFVSSAIIDNIGIEKVFFVGTKESMWDNLAEIFDASEEYYLSLVDKKEQNILSANDLFELSAVVDKKLSSSGSQCFILKDSEKETDLWEMFDKFLEILSHLTDKDEVYFDITHLFRSVSVLSFIMAEFGKINQDIKIAGMFYGMLKKDEASPIVNLSIFFELLDWARAIGNLKKYGNSFELMKLLKDSDGSKEIKSSFKNFSDAISISDIGALQSSIKQLKGKINLFVDSPNNIHKLISKDLVGFIDRFNIESLAKFQFELAKWYVENKNFAFAYITLAESVVSIVCENEKLDSTSKDDREKAKKILWEYDDWKISSNEKNKIGEAFSKVNNIRNNIAHKLSSNGSKTKSQPANSIENIEDYIKKFTPLFNKKQEV